MTSRERVKKAINHQEPDRVPMDFFGTEEVQDKLRQKFNLPKTEPPYNATTRFFDPAILDKLETDLRNVRPAYIGPSLQKFEDGSYTDIFGCRRVMVANDAGVYDEVINPPLAHAATVEEVDAHPWPDPEWFDFSTVKEQCEMYEDKAIVIGSFGIVDFINISSRFRGMEQVLLDIGMENPVVYRIFDRLSDFFYGYMRRFYDICPEKYMIAFYGDDYGTQMGPVISPQTFRKIFMPRWKRHFDLAHKHGLKVMFHSCGSTRMLMPDLIETGIDILETVQPETANMAPKDLKQNFGDKLAFHGMISVQKVLPNSSPEEVKKVVKERLEVIGLGCGYASDYGSILHDEIFVTDPGGDPPEQKFYRKSNNAGGIEGGMTNGEPIVARFALKPLATLPTPLASVNIFKKTPDKAHRERTDTFILPAAAVIGEAVLALTVAEAVLEKFGGDSMEEVQERMKKTEYLYPLK